MTDDGQTKYAASEGTCESPCSPKFHPGQMVRVLHTWAAGHPARPVVRACWDESWNCYTYVLPLSLIQVEEHELEATGEPDMVPDAWVKRYWANGEITCER